MQAFAPAAAYFPGEHGVGVLVPSQAYPSAQSEQAVLLKLVPPVVNDPGGQAVQELAFSFDQVLSAPHDEQRTDPPALNVPAGHTDVRLPPGHAHPPGHTTHFSRVVVDPPLVDEPGLHVKHLLAPGPLYRLSAPQSRHVSLPAKLNLPAGHGSWVLSPVQNDPAGH